MLFTRRGLFLWHMPSYARRNARHTLADFFREMWIAPALAVGLAVLVLAIAANPGRSRAVRHPAARALAGVAGGRLVDQPAAASAGGGSQRESTAVPADLARRTWRFFADFVGPEDNWLPPDNFQEYPAAALASRTSPTNIGMALLANLAAYDFGYLSAGEFLQRPTAPWRPWKSWNATAAISTTGTTRARCNRSFPDTSLRSTAATWPAACSPCKRDCRVEEPAGAWAINAFQGLQDTLAVLGGAASSVAPDPAEDQVAAAVIAERAAPRTGSRYVGRRALGAAGRDSCGSPRNWWPCPLETTMANSTTGGRHSIANAAASAMT